MNHLKETTIYEVNTLFEGSILANEMTDHFIIACLEVKQPGRFRAFHPSYRFYPPLPSLSKVTFGEFIVADMLFSSFSQTQDDKKLDRFVACLYRSMKTGFDLNSNDDRREKFNDAYLGYHAEIIAFVPRELKMNIFYNYAGVRKWLTCQYPEVFKPAGKDDGEGDWLLIRDKLTDNVKDYDLTDNALLHDVLRRLNNQLKYAET